MIVIELILNVQIAISCVVAAILLRETRRQRPAEESWRNDLC
jgi:hypothetical protein